MTFPIVTGLIAFAILFVCPFIFSADTEELEQRDRESMWNDSVADLGARDVDSMLKGAA